MHIFGSSYIVATNARHACTARLTVVGLCVCVCVCQSLCPRLFWQNMLQGGLWGDFPEMTAYRRYGVKTSECNLYTLLTTFIQLDGHTYWLYAKNHKDFQLTDFSITAAFESLNAFCSSLALWLLQSTPTRSSRICAHLVYTWPSHMCGTRSKAIQCILVTLRELRHT